MVKLIRKYAMPFALLIVAMCAPALLVYFLWTVITRFEYSSWLTVIGLVMLIHFEQHLWPILREQIKRL